MHTAEQFAALPLFRQVHWVHRSGQLVQLLLIEHLPVGGCATPQTFAHAWGSLGFRQVQPSHVSAGPQFCELLLQACCAAATCWAHVCWAALVMFGSPLSAGHTTPPALSAHWNAAIEAFAQSSSDADRLPIPIWHWDTQFADVIGVEVQLPPVPVAPASALLEVAQFVPSWMQGYLSNSAHAIWHKLPPVEVLEAFAGWSELFGTPFELEGVSLAFVGWVPVDGAPEPENEPTAPDPAPPQPAASAATTPIIAKLRSFMARLHRQKG